MGPTQERVLEMEAFGEGGEECSDKPSGSEALDVLPAGIYPKTDFSRPNGSFTIPTDQDFSGIRHGAARAVLCTAPRRQM